MSAVAIIPARSGSRRIPNKNIRPFMGRPIISYSIAAAKPLFDRIIVSTDDYAIAEVAKEYGAEVLFRDASLARDEVGTQEVMAHVLRSIDARPETTTVCLYPCAPLVDANDIRIAVQIGVLRPARYVVSVAADPLRDIGNFYAGSAEDFMNEVPLYSAWTGLYVMPHERAIDINTEADWLQAEQMYAALHKGA